MTTFILPWSLSFGLGSVKGWLPLASFGFRLNGLQAQGLESPESSLAHMFAGGCWPVGAVSQSTTCGLSPWPWLPHNMVARFQVWEPQKREPGGSRVLFVTQPWSHIATILLYLLAREQSHAFALMLPERREHRPHLLEGGVLRHIVRRAHEM